MRALLWVGLLGCQEVLLHDLPEAEANEVVATLAAAGVAGEKQGRGQRTAVKVPTGEVATAWTALRAAGWPRPAPPPPPDRLVVGPTEAQLIDQQRAARALERVLLGLPGVQDARVALSEAGAAVAVRGVADEAQIASLVRAALPPNAKISIEINPLPPPVAARPAGRGPLVGLSVAVVTLAAACALLLIRLRQLRRRR